MASQGSERVRGWRDLCVSKWAINSSQTFIRSERGTFRHTFCAEAEIERRSFAVEKEEDQKGDCDPFLTVPSLIFSPLEQIRKELFKTFFLPHKWDRCINLSTVRIVDSANVCEEQ
jgi:hypothetical protein